MAGRTLIPIGMADRDTCRHRYSRMAHCNFSRSMEPIHLYRT